MRHWPAGSLRHSSKGLRGRELKLVLLETWGDGSYIGLTGLQVMDAEGRPLKLSPSDLDAIPLDLNDLPGCFKDVRTLDKLLDGANVVLQRALFDNLAFVRFAVVEI